MSTKNLGAVFFVAVLAGCGSSEEGTKSPAEPECTGDASSGPCVTSVVGALVDSTGAAVADAPVSVCGAICYSGKTDAGGVYDVEIKAYIDPSAYHVLVHDRPLKAGFYYPLPMEAEGGILDAGTSLLLALPTDGPTIATSGAGAPAQTLTSGDVVLDIPDGVDVHLDIEDVLLGEDGAKFRAVTVPESDSPSFVDPDLGVLALYALGPFEATFTEKGTTAPARVRVSFANTTGLPADAAVELLAMGSYYVPEGLLPGEFGPVASGHVSTDGASVSLDPGEGIEYVTWLALREAR